MKKIIPILFIISLLLLVGCKTKSDQCDLNNDSKVDAIEERRCGQTYQGQQQTQSKCGDGICDNIERQKGVCPEDCEIALKDCGSSKISPEIQDTSAFDCFIEASEDCTPSKLSLSMTLNFDIFGFISSSDTLLEMDGMEGSNCIFSQTTKTNSVEPTDEAVQSMLDSGLTQAEIDEQEKTANENVQMTIGMKTTCKFSTEDLTGMLNRWKQGTYSSEDLVGCEVAGRPAGQTAVQSQCAEPCEGCVSGKQSEVQTGTGTECYDCLFDSKCKDDYICFNKQCISVSYKEENTIPCPDTTDVWCDNRKCGCDEFECEGCRDGTMFGRMKRSGSGDEAKVTECLCYECADVKGCAEGYICDKYKCVKE